jgi:hypothetical protein
MTPNKAMNLMPLRPLSRPSSGCFARKERSLSAGYRQVFQARVIT